MALLGPRQEARGRRLSRQGIFRRAAGIALIQEAVVTVPRRLIAEAIDLLVFISGRGLARRVETVARVTGLDPDGGYGVVELTSDHPKTGD